MIFGFGFLLVIGGVAALPFLLSDDPRTRERIYMPLSAVPVLLIVLFVLSGFNGYSVALLSLVVVFPMSLAFTATGFLLVVLARRADEARGRLTAAALLAAGPILFWVVLLVFDILFGK